MNEIVEQIDSIAGMDSTAGSLPVSGETPEQLPFCFGAAGLTTLWCFFHGRAGLGTLYLLLGLIFIPLGKAGVAGWLFTEVVGWTIAIAMGCAGSRIAWYERVYHSIRDLERGESGWNVAGMIFLGLRVLLTVVALVMAGSMA